MNLALLEWVHNHLDRARLVLLIDTCEECPSVVHYFNLTQVYTLLEASELLAILSCSLLKFSNRFVHTRCEDNWKTFVTVWLESLDARKVDIWKLLAPNKGRAIQTPHVDGSIPGTGDEARVVLEPSN